MEIRPGLKTLLAPHLFTLEIGAVGWKSCENMKMLIVEVNFLHDQHFHVSAFSALFQILPRPSHLPPKRLSPENRSEP